MSETRPFSDFASHPFEIVEQIGKSGRAVILTESGVGDLVLMPRSSYEKYEDNKALNELHDKLQERALQAETSEIRRSHDEVMRGARSIIKQGYEQSNV